MQQIADWLEKLGMSEYVQRFAENRIDFSVLPDLTDQDLKDLGVALGDRRKILRAIADLNLSRSTNTRSSRLGSKTRMTIAHKIGKEGEVLPWRPSDSIFGQRA